MVTKSTVASAALAGLLGFVATAAVYLKHRDIVVDFERGYEGAFVESFHPRERAEGKFFRWTTGESYLTFQNLPATGTVSVEARLKTIRPGGVALPELAFTVNGVTMHRARALPGSVVLPPLSVGEMTLRLYAALNYSQNSARDFRRALNGA